MTQKGQPHHKTTGVLRHACHHAENNGCNQRSTRNPNIGPIASTNKGRVQTAATRNRRHKSRCIESSSTCGDESENASGSSAIPHVGHAAGWPLVTPGHIGQE